MRQRPSLIFVEITDRAKTISASGGGSGCIHLFTAVARYWHPCDGENLYGGNLYGGSAQGVSGTSSEGGGAVFQ